MSESVSTEQLCHDSDRGKPEFLDKNLSQWHSLRHKFQVEWPGIESGPATRRLKHGAYPLWLFFHIILEFDDIWLVLLNGTLINKSYWFRKLNVKEGDW